MPAALTTKMPDVKQDGRRVSKPLMEKRRRARINQCLSQLKSLLLNNTRNDSPRHSKLEKADILEMTVCHLQALHRQRRTASLLTDPSVRHKFRAGYEECILEIRRFLSTLTSPAAGLPVLEASRDRILGHLHERAREIADMELTASEIHDVQPPLTKDRPSSPADTSTPPDTTYVEPSSRPVQQVMDDISTAATLRGVQVTPTRLKNGDLMFVLPKDLVSGVASTLHSDHQATITSAMTSPPPTPGFSEANFSDSSSSDGSGASLLSNAECLRDNGNAANCAKPQQFDEKMWRPW
ncbi:transcription factor HES-4-like [Ornithodoros turicata]|uniref:transcription factor HES-4-like n=1 Tax=Ornithodoros turicata TaxID=34597 RepID=UPI003138B604